MGWSQKAPEAKIKERRSTQGACLLLPSSRAEKEERAAMPPILVINALLYNAATKEEEGVLATQLHIFYNYWKVTLFQPKSEMWRRRKGIRSS